MTKTQQASPVGDAALDSEQFVRCTGCLPDQHCFGIQSLFSLILSGGTCRVITGMVCHEMLHGEVHDTNLACTCADGAALMHRGCGGLCGLSAGEPVGNAIRLHCSSLVAGSHLQVALWALSQLHAWPV